MFGCGITFVMSPVVGWKLVCQSVHEVVAVSLGQDRGGGNGEVGGVTFHYTSVGNAPMVLETVAIDKDKLGFHGKFPDCKVHAVDGGVQNVHLVNVNLRHFGDGVCQSITFNDLSQQIPLAFRKLLGIIDFFVGVIIREDDGGGAYRTSKTAAAYFITAAFKGGGERKVGF